MIVQIENEISLELFDDTFEASVVDSFEARGDVFIPLFIEFESQKYFITCVKEGSFKNNLKINSVKFSENSKVHTIEKEAFSYSSIRYISIPPHVKQVGDLCFSNCQSLQKIEFTENSELQNIGEKAFLNSAIEEIMIPLHVTSISDQTFSKCKKLKTVKFPENSELSLIEKSAFAGSSLTNILIPQHVK